MKLTLNYRDENYFELEDADQQYRFRGSGFHRRSDLFMDESWELTLSFPTREALLAAAERALS